MRFDCRLTIIRQIFLLSYRHCETTKKIHMEITGKFQPGYRDEIIIIVYVIIQVWNLTNRRDIASSKISLVFFFAEIVENSDLCFFTELQKIYYTVLGGHSGSRKSKKKAKIIVILVLFYQKCNCIWKTFHPGNRAGVFIWEVFQPGYSDLSCKKCAQYCTQWLNCIVCLRLKLLRTILQK